ncbi:MAG: hypothetical protein AAFV43_12155 [Planctomycetota bacterium]
MSEAALADPPIEDQQAPVSEAAAAPEEDTRPRCEKCGAPNDAAACPACGWYPAAGVFVEIDKAYEALHNPELATQEAEEAPQSELQKHLDVWRTLIPTWGWIIIGICLTLVISSAVARVYFDATGSAWRTTYSLTQLFFGVLALIVAHLTAFVLCSSEDAELGPKDVLVKPFKAWRTIVADLPDRVWLVQVGSGALAAILCATLIIGGIPYERLLDWGFKQRAQTNLVGAIAEQAKQLRAEEKSMEESMNDFASDAAGGLLEGDAENAPEKPRTKIDCLLIGYRLTKERRIDSVLLATETGGRLKYIGDVRPKLTPEERDELFAKFDRAEATRPFVRTNATAQWLRPKFTCKASYTEWPEGKSRPRELRWEELLEEMSLPW